ncbi:hypothetical protein SAMN05660841_00145 [Sphingobacterium nematocida]|uniref:Helix-turn-helix n=1 Tax=Sphingobacterium nematocida TaxID=1513896 RepID=A0A1T5AT61_9SPHI|nr:hypothetical protein [Sphingobacterium nematocida]SKB38105.1 hypothetical protein SAMN05660841_00145 [Sphingobacterium nematocida]
MEKVKDEEQEQFQRDLLDFINIQFISPISIKGKRPTIRQYVEIMNIRRTTINKLTTSNGYDVPISTIRKVCKYAKISIAEFFTMFEAYLKEKESVIEK